VKVCALIGYPLAHSVTPAMYAPALAEMGIDARCEKWVTPPGELKARVHDLRQPGVMGANVTVPHKEAVVALLDGLDRSAEEVGAVNCIVSLESALRGHNTDKYGFMRSLEEAGFKARGCRALLLGAGGAARAVATGLLQAGAARLTIANRTASRAEALRLALADNRVTTIEMHAEEVEEACAAADLIVNSTPMGTADTDLAGNSPLEERSFRKDVWVYDLVYNPPLTPFLALARRAGARTVPGLEMLIYQGAESLRLFTGQDAPIETMRVAARRALQSR
jgi:shikimate dehydrogenase